MDNLRFQNITITQIQYINVQQILVVTCARVYWCGPRLHEYGLCGPRGQKAWTALAYRLTLQPGPMQKDCSENIIIVNFYCNRPIVQRT